MRIRERIPERSERVIRLARPRSDRIEGKPKRPAAVPPGGGQGGGDSGPFRAAGRVAGSVAQPRTEALGSDCAALIRSAGNPGLICSRMSLMAAGQRSSLMQNLFLRLTTTSGEEIRDRYNSLNLLDTGEKMNQSSLTGCNSRPPTPRLPTGNTRNQRSDSPVSSMLPGRNEGWRDRTATRGDKPIPRFRSRPRDLAGGERVRLPESDRTTA